MDAHRPRYSQGQIAPSCGSKGPRGEATAARDAKGEPAAALKDTASGIDAKQENGEPEVLHLQYAPATEPPD